MSTVDIRMGPTLVLSLALLSGCAATGSLTAATQQAPGVLGEVEQLKTAVTTAPIAGCVAMLQQVQTQMSALKNGTPGIPVAAAPNVAPVLTVPP